MKRTLLAVVVCSAPFLQDPTERETVLDAGYHHLGDNPTPEWPEASEEPEGTRLDVEFESRANADECCLILEQRHISNRWAIVLNEREIGTLDRRQDLTERTYSIPKGALRDGRNSLAIVPSTPTDDIVVGKLRLVRATFREHFDLKPVTITVLDADSRSPVPARVTFRDLNGHAPTVYFGDGLLSAVREGLAYTANGELQCELPSGPYRVWASKGTEWGVAEGQLLVGDDGGATLQLAVRREVATPNFIACDTHIHTLTFSGHGDAEVEERVVTLAAEGVELAIATDHNHQTDYRAYQSEAGLQDHYTAVTGNEVTTEIGHFNAFPLPPGGPLPDHKLTDLVKLVDDIRLKGAKAVILNHPRWPDREKGPFGVWALDRLTGAHSLPAPLPVDATELVNSTTDQVDPLYLFNDWFALLNRGETLRAVGSSDSHTVGDPVGQGRTYLASSTDDPAAIDVDEAARSLVEGRSSVSFGIFADLTIDGIFSMGDTVQVANGRFQADLRVAAASWVTPREVIVFVNGAEHRRLPIRDEDGPYDERLSLPIELPWAHDAWLVCVVLGDGIDAPYWKTINDYTLAATNPVFLDVDGDGQYTNPARTAAAMFEKTGSGVDELTAALKTCDQAVALQLLDLARNAFAQEARAKLQRTGEAAAAAHEGVRAYLEQHAGD